MSRVPIMEQHKSVFLMVGAATFALGSAALPGLLNLFETREKTDISVPPPTGRVDRYSALVTGTASSEFPIDATADCPGVGGINVRNGWTALATVANKIGDFTVGASADKTAVTITLDRFPQLESGLEMDQSRTDSSEDSFFTACDGGDIIKVGVAMMRAAQATADTIGDCIVQQPDFQAGLQNQLEAFGEAAYPAAVGNVQVIMPTQPELGSVSAAQTALDSLRAELSDQGVNIVSDAIDNCEFEEFTMTPIVFVPGGGVSLQP
jgi:hypothetical protein